MKRGRHRLFRFMNMSCKEEISVFFKSAALAVCLVAAPVAASAASTMHLEVQRPRIYEGETATLTVSVEGDTDVKGVPSFPDFTGGTIECFDTRSSSSQSISIINGHMEKQVSVRRTYYFRATPAGKGMMRTGRAELRLDDGTVLRTRGGETIEVVGITVRPDIWATISTRTNMVLVDGAFPLKLTIAVRALDEPNAEVEPIHPAHPLHVIAEFFDPIDMRGLDLPSPNDYLAPLLLDSSYQEPGFTVNDYKRQAGPSMGGLFGMDLFSDPFEMRQCVFRFPVQRIERGGTNFWEYSLSFDCKPKAEGSYTFGPAKIKGSIIIGPNRDGTPKFDSVYLIAPALTVHVVPPPEKGRPDFFIGGVGKGMAATATLDTDHCKVGDPLTLTLDLVGEVSTENLRAPVLSLQPNASSDFRIYDNNVESSRLPEGRRFKYRVRPLRSGTLEFPAISVAYYDTVSNRYVTATTPAMPVQVEATTQIAAISQIGEDGLPMGTGLAGANLAPDGIMLAPVDQQPLAFSHGKKGLVAWIVGLPLLWAVVWLLGGLVRLLRRLVGKHNPKRLAAAAFGRFHQAVRGCKKDPKQAAVDAARAVRAYVAALCQSPSVSLTADEMRSLFKDRRLEDDLVRRFCDVFSTLEQLPYGRDGASPERIGKVLGEMDEAMRALSGAISKKPASSRSLVLIAFLFLLPVTVSAMGQRPDSFEWERANDAMASAKTPADFEAAARLYYGQATNGAASGPLYYNLGTALLLGGKSREASEAFVYAERYLGTLGGISRNWEMAIADQEAAESFAPARRLPVSRIFLCWHYGLPWSVRTDIAVGGWIVLWAALLFRLLFTTRPARGSSPGVLRVFTNFLAVLGLALAVLFGASSVLSLLQEKHDPITLPGLEETVRDANQPASETEVMR